MEERKFCQSCAMPMDGDGAQYGTEADGGKSADYCSYCYQGGKFTSDQTMEQMIDTCVPFVLDHYKTEEAARAAMGEIFPKLKRWAQA